MTYQHPDSISVSETVSMDVRPQWVVLYVDIEGSAVVYGNEAFRKAKEVSSFVSHLEGAGYATENVSLENIMVQVKTGVISKETAARFELKLDKVNLDTLPEILSIVAGQKNIAVVNLEYEFGTLRDERAELRQKACRAAKGQAEEICQALGVDLQGVYSMTFNWSSPAFDAMAHGVGVKGGKRKARSMSGGEFDGINFVADKKDVLRLTINAEFRVGSFR